MMAAHFYVFSFHPEKKRWGRGGDKEKGGKNEKFELLTCMWNPLVPEPINP
jgi:hypothetical protein